MLKLRRYIFLALFVFLLPPLTVRADIGVSPSVMELSILPNSESRQLFRLTRSGEELDIDLKVNVTTNSPYIDLQGQDSIILLAGEQQSDYIFLVKSPNLEFGEHDAMVYFSPDIQKKNNSGNTIKYALGAKVKFKVVDRITEDINATLMPQDEFIQFGKIESSVFFLIKQRVKIKSSLKNSSENSFKEVPYRVEIYEGETMVSNLKTVASQSLPAQGELPIEYSYIPEELGRYAIVFSNEKHRESKTIIVLPTFSYLYDSAKKITIPMGEKLMAWWLNR